VGRGLHASSRLSGRGRANSGIPIPIQRDIEAVELRLGGQDGDRDPQISRDGGEAVSDVVFCAEEQSPAMGEPSSESLGEQQPAGAVVRPDLGGLVEERAGSSTSMMSVWGRRMASRPESLSPASIWLSRPVPGWWMRCNRR
jgi:hypothetical protein